MNVLKDDAHVALMIDSDTLPYIVPSICAVAAPGHTPGHIALSITSEG